MSEKPYLKYLFSGAIALLTLPATSLAATETVTATTAGTVASSGSYTFNAPQFNASLGTLTSVELSLTFDTTPVFTAYNASNLFASPGTPESFTNGTASTSASISLTDFGGQSPLVINSGVTTAGPFSGTVLPGIVMTLNNATPNAFGPVTVFDSDLTPYEGAGTISLNSLITEDSGVFSGTKPSNDPDSAYLFFGGHDNVFGNLSVEYFYNAVPEPSSWALLAISLGALFYSRRFLAKRNLES